MAHLIPLKVVPGPTVRLWVGASLTPLDLDAIEQEAIASGALIRRYQFDPDMYAVVQRTTVTPWASRKRLIRPECRRAWYET